MLGSDHGSHNDQGAIPNGPPVPAPRERRWPGALELDVAADAVLVDDLAEQDGAAVTELGHEMAELVPGIGHGDRLGALGQAFAGEDFGALGRRKLVRIEPELNSQLPVQLDQAGGGHGRWRHAGEEIRRQGGIGVLEGKLQRHGSKIGARRAIFEPKTAA